jgi:hypothetical protein
MVVDPMPPCRGYPGLHVASYVIFWTSGFVNPVIYIFSNRNYRNACISLFTSRCQTYSVQPTLSSNLGKTDPEDPSLNLHEMKRLTSAEQHR